MDGWDEKQADKWRNGRTDTWVERQMEGGGNKEDDGRWGWTGAVD